MPSADGMAASPIQTSLAGEWGLSERRLPSIMRCQHILRALQVGEGVLRNNGATASGAITSNTLTKLHRRAGKGGG